ncbi:MAG: phosphoadenylyl-sulfate reductase [Deltaproteobacteria bacterium]|nr:phosphoadenylyl-sulfate reductase [Deltaproteobacteria bacterium]
MEKFEGIKDPQKLLNEATAAYGRRLELACSFGPEDLVLIDMLSKTGNEFGVFALDTGRLPEETLEVADEIRRKFAIEIRWMFPDTQAVEKLEREKGLFSFRESLDNRHECCGIRKVEPLNRALEGLSAWITGRRQEQSITRFDLAMVEVDQDREGVLKFNPLAAWTSRRVWSYVKDEGLPYNRLHDQGYPSIGCAPCTRAVGFWDDERSGRWWWETPDSKECGLHVAHHDDEVEVRT